MMPGAVEMIRHWTPLGLSALVPCLLTGLYYPLDLARYLVVPRA